MVIMDSRASISQSLTEHAIPLQTSGPNAELSDLTTVVGSFADATIIGLGEATHGTREFFRFKHRLLQYLIVEEGLRLIALESNFSETLAINDYITNGDGDPLDALEGVYFWTWNTEEVLELIKWLRNFNKDRPSRDQVKFYGVDMQFTPGPARALNDYLAKVDSIFRAENAGTLEMLADMGLNDEERRDERLAEADRFAVEFGDRFAEREAEYIGETSRREYELAVQHHRTLEQAIEAKYASQTDDAEFRVQIRDNAMAENASWVLDYEPHDTMAIWAHNAHVRRGTLNTDDSEEGQKESGGKIRVMGDYLAEKFGDDYAVLGFNFAEGSFRAISNEADGYNVEEFRLDEPREGSITKVLAKVDEPRYFLDIEDCLQDEVLRTIFTEKREIRTVGAFYYGQDADEHYETVVAGEAYDGLIFFESTSSAVPNK